MPKKRFNSQYSKPQSTVHPSLESASGASASTSRNDAAPSVNDLISTLRKTQITTPDGQRKATSAMVTPTLPPALRSLLSLPETPAPRPRARDRRRFDENGRRIPAGPPPPRSWLETSRHVPGKMRSKEEARLYAVDISIAHLPGITLPIVGSLQDVCLRQMAQNWIFIKDYEKYNLSELPTRMRSSLLSYIAVYGPEGGIGFEALQNLLRPPLYEDGGQSERVSEDINDNFNRLDLSGSIGRSVSFKQLSELAIKCQEDDNNESWEETIPMSINPTISHLTHLSLSHPPPYISWAKFLSFAQHVPAITHLSLAYWPVPNLTPNSKTAVMASQYGKDVQYGGTNIYSHCIDDDFSEASAILRRLATSLYSLRWLDLTGCTHWLKALQYLCADEVTGIDWRWQWSSLDVIVARYGYEFEEGCRNEDILAFKKSCVQAMCTKTIIQDLRRLRGLKRWIEVEMDDVAKWDGLLTSNTNYPDLNEVNRQAMLSHEHVQNFTQSQQRISGEADENWET